MIIFFYFCVERGSAALKKSKREYSCKISCYVLDKKKKKIGKMKLFSKNLLPLLLTLYGFIFHAIYFFF